MNMFDSYNEDEEPEFQYKSYTLIRHTTDKAILFDCEGILYWVPKSAIIEDIDNCIAVPDWFTFKPA